MNTTISATFAIVSPVGRDRRAGVERVQRGHREDQHARDRLHRSGPCRPPDKIAPTNDANNSAANAIGAENPTTSDTQPLMNPNAG